MDLSGAIWRKSSRSNVNGGDCVEVAAWRKSSQSGPNGGQSVEVAAWRKSNRSSTNGGACVEVAMWRKSNHSNVQGGCVEVAPLPGVVAVRDSKNPDGPALTLTHTAWHTLTHQLKQR